jgi:hypothetical protein
VTVNTVVALTVNDDADLDAHGKELFPEADGWSDHVTTYTEIEQGLILGEYRLTWQADKV